MKIQLMKRIRDKELKALCKQMSIMIASGCDILNILSILINSSSNLMSSNLISVRNSLEKGKNLKESFLSTNAFSNFFISMISAGETSGKIDYVLDEMSRYYDREYKTKSKLLSASVYPIMLIIVSNIVFVFMLVFIVPNFETAFNVQDMELPFYTKFIFALSKYVKSNAVMLIVYVVTFIYLAVSYLVNSSRARYFFDSKLLTIPKIKDLGTLVVSDKFSRTLYILLGSGIYINDSIDIAVKVVNNRYVDEKMNIAKKNIEKGNSITQSLKMTGLFPEIFISMLTSGEESGQFEESLKFVSEYYSEELDIKLEKYMKMIEPIMIVVIGVIIGAMMIAVLSPMFEIISRIE